MVAETGTSRTKTKAGKNSGGSAHAHADIARVTISETLLRFFAFRSQRVGNDTAWAYLWALVRFQEYMDGNACYMLNKEESALYDRLSDPKSKEPREFCEIFGPEKIPRHTYGFTECHLVDELIGTDRSRATVRAAIRKLETWLIDAGYVEPDRDRGIHRRARPRRALTKPREKVWPRPEAPPMSLTELRETWAKLTGRTEA